METPFGFIGFPLVPFSKPRTMIGSISQRRPLTPFAEAPVIDYSCATQGRNAASSYLRVHGSVACNVKKESKKGGSARVPNTSASLCHPNYSKASDHIPSFSGSLPPVTFPMEAVGLLSWFLARGKSQIWPRYEQHRHGA